MLLLHCNPVWGGCIVIWASETYKMNVDGGWLPPTKNNNRHHPLWDSSGCSSVSPRLFTCGYPTL